MNMEEKLRLYSEFEIDSDFRSKSFTSEDLDLPVDVNDVNNPFGFFERYGFMVIAPIADRDDSNGCIREIEEVYEKSDKSNQISFPFNEDGSSKSPVIKESLILNKTNPIVFKSFSKLLKTEQLLVDHDKVVYYKSSNANVDQTTLDKINNIGLEMNPFIDAKSSTKELDSLNYSKLNNFSIESHYLTEGLNVQGLINFFATHRSGGCLHIVPGFHHIYDEYFESKNKKSSNPSYQFEKSDFVYAAAKPIATVASAIIIFNQKVPHGIIMKANTIMDRISQSVKLFPVSSVSPKRLEARTKALKAIIESGKSFDKLKELSEKRGCKTNQLLGFEL